jgi:hypothetical protein
VRILGFGPVDLGVNIDWSRDYQSGAAWRMIQSSLLRPQERGTAGDVRLVWELSRCHHFLPLALEFILSGDPSCPNEFRNQVVSWTEQNGFEQGINWTSPSETAFRTANWLLAYRLFAEKWEFENEFSEMFALQLLKAGQFIYSNLERIGSGLNTSNYIANLVGLLMLGELFATAHIGKEWRDLAVEQLEHESRCQTDADGFCRESSLPYHGLVCEMLVYALLLSRQSEIIFSSEFEHTVAQMLDHLETFTQADGTVVPFGDSDDSRLLRPCARAPRDFRDVIGIGRRLLDLANDMQPETAEELLIFGPDGCRRGIRAEKPTRLLADSGICQLRAHDMTVNFFANGPAGPAQDCHKHNDLLSLTLEYKGCPVFIDPGTFTYRTARNQRDCFRGTAQHNTIMLDREEQNRLLPNLPFNLRNDSRPAIKILKTDRYSDLVSAITDSYLRLEDPVLHRRSLYLDKQREVLLIRDDLEGSGVHEIEANFHLEAIQLLQEECRTVRLLVDDDDSLLFTLLEPQICLGLTTNWISPAYGSKEPGLRMFVRHVGRLPLTLLFAVAPVGDDLTATHSAINRARQQIDW